MEIIDNYLWVPAVLMGIVFLNRYIAGSFLLMVRAKRAPHNLRSQKIRETWPTVTVIVPLFNEGESIFRTLRSLSDQDYPRELLRIVVVDDCSQDDSNMWAMRAARHDSRITVVRNSQNIGKRLGIARAVGNASSEFVVSVDSDVLVHSLAIRRLIAGFTSDKVAAVGGSVYVANAQENWLTKMQSIKYFFGYHFLKNLERSFAQVLCLSGCLTAYRRAVLVELEPILLSRNLFGIAIKYGEDRFLTRQIVKAGYETSLELSAICMTKAPATIRGYFQQQLRWRRSNIADFLGGMTHCWRYHPVVAVHYAALNCLMLSYPVFLWIQAVEGSLFAALPLHLAVLAGLAGIYWWKSHEGPAESQVFPGHVMWLALILPVTYMVLSVHALMTLDSSSWETRKAASGTRVLANIK